MNKQIYITKHNGEREIFDIEKLKTSLIRADATTKIADKIAEQIAGELLDGVTTHEIYKKAFALLKKEENVLAAKYSVKRAVAELGPQGFPFEDFIGEIFRAQEYKVSVGQTVNGRCVLHEIDVIAENDKEFVAAEVKFHSNYGIKSDFKTALYIKARFDDLEAGGFYKGKKNKKIRKILVTNTKFSSRAVKYGKCVGLELIGWNYPPEQGNLQDLIKKTKLHPLTCLSSLNKKEKQDFLNQGIVLCRDIKAGGENILKQVGISGNKVKSVMNEASQLCR